MAVILRVENREAGDTPQQYSCDCGMVETISLLEIRTIVCCSALYELQEVTYSICIFSHMCLYKLFYSITCKAIIMNISYVV